MKKTIIPIIFTSLLISSNIHAANLEQIIQASRLNDYQVEILYEDYLSTYQNINTIHSAYQPRVTLDGSGNVLSSTNKDFHTNKTNYSTELGLNMTYPIYDPSKSSKEKIASLNEAKSYITLIDYLNNQTAHVTKLYYEVLKKRDVLTVDIETRKAVKKHHDKVQHMAEVGLKTLVDVAEVKAQLDQSDANIIKSENDLKNAISKMYVYTGNLELVPEKITFKDAVENLESHGYEYWHDKMIDNNTTLKMAKIDELIAKESIKLIDSENDFRLDLKSGLGADFTGVGGSMSNNDIDYSVSIGLNFTLPVFDGGYNDSRVKVQIHEMNKASLNVKLAMRKSEPELSSLYNEIDSLSKRINALEKAVESSKFSYLAIEDGYKIGTRDVVDVLTANADYSIAKKNLYESQYDYLIKQSEFKSKVENIYNL